MSILSSVLPSPVLAQPWIDQLDKRASSKATQQKILDIKILK